ncbi:MAG TPA: hypothetical protein VG053_12210 [Solirubrobacteraceae bacterium]|jgi:hypothetical protein|nr:hypothetical protein [Solirubrobacteraceae bacterium]
MKIRSSEPTSTRGARGLGGSVAVIAALVTAATLSACGSSSSSSSTASAKTNLNTPHIERAIEQSILSERHVHARVVCPRVVPQEKGHDFTCIATVGKSTTPFAVVQQDNRGYVTYQAK